MEVVQLRSTPIVSDVPAQLRSMADAIEGGKIECPSALFIISTGGEPDIFMWGEHEGDLANIGLLELAKAVMVREKLTAGEDA